VGLTIAVLGIAAWVWLHWRRAESVVPPHSWELRADRMDEWKAYGGSWEMANGIVRSDSYERGAKLLSGSKYWGNYTLNADLRFEGVAADMGIIIRANDESEGVDSYNGYFVGLRSLDGTLVMGHSNYAWVEVPPVYMPGGVHPFVWYRMRVTAYGCNIAASMQNLTTLQTAWIAFEERSCVLSGRIGLRTLNADGMWQNVSVEPAGSNDYFAMERHAVSVEHPVILDGPPWWTPWHVGMLFAGALAFALLAQRIYFRIQRWKAYTIIQERERLAHEIHDTMAQSFAGVGYQIQGIRRSVVRGDHQDSRHIADQLSVAYQLVRKCHVEASRTIAMLGSSSPQIQQNLLGSLADTARRIAGDQIKTVTKLEGYSTPLNLRLADAMLHIGQEAIANAVSHSDPTQLAITLSFDGNSVELVVQDDGNGFEFKQKTAGFGILGMQKRASDVAGSLQILSTPGHGTEIHMRASLQQESPRRRLVSLFKERILSTPPDFNAH
jgi:signal transduction histidine kinase